MNPAAQHIPETSLVLLFVKAPIKGRVKSRLAVVVGEEAALALYRGFILDTIAAVEEVGDGLRIAVHPPDALQAVSAWLGPSYELMPQRGDDLGARMSNAFEAAFAQGCSRAILIGSDIPDLPSQMVRDSLAALESHDAVIGPAEDGGYYLIGFQRSAFLPAIFRGMAWSTNTVFYDTMHKLREASLRVHVAPQWRDVDTREDLQALIERSRGSSFERSHTMEYLKKHPLIPD